jgi:hypothetical protein
MKKVLPFVIVSQTDDRIILGVRDGLTTVEVEHIIQLFYKTITTDRVMIFKIIKHLKGLHHPTYIRVESCD